MVNEQRYHARYNQATDAIQAIIASAFANDPSVILSPGSASKDGDAVGSSPQTDIATLLAPFNPECVSIVEYSERDPDNAYIRAIISSSDRTVGDWVLIFEFCCSAESQGAWTTTNATLQPPVQAPGQVGNYRLFQDDTVWPVEYINAIDRRSDA
jgi:hypothetical protein